ncbi:MAG TPA: transglutaminase domain-containing protein [Puia sp.]|nr:transglutaminase domain-containing protein [Puia sp.]
MPPTRASHLAITICLFCTYCLWGAESFGQAKLDKDLPPVTTADFVLPASPAIDSSSTAVILANFGDIHFVGNQQGWFSYVFRVHERIKILNKKAFEGAATVRVYLNDLWGDPEKLDNIVASTFNLENGQLQVVKLDKKDIFEDRMNKEWRVTKWTMPAVREGSIIDYSYTITSSYDVRLPTWKFQSELFPCLKSELQIDIPQTLLYTLIKQGIHPYAVDRGSAGSETYRIGRKDNTSLVNTDTWESVDATTVRHQWIMKDIPAFGQESFLTTPKNYIDRLDFQLSKTYDGEKYSDFYNSWRQATDQLLELKDFGKALDDDNQDIDDMAETVTRGADGASAKARAIYYYVCQHFACNDYNDQFIQTSLPDVLKKRGGTVGDINLLMIAMLRRLGLQADPVVLSTREFGSNLASYPVLQRLNYVIARVVIDGNIIYLDATHPKLGFGQLAENCYNGPARIISNIDSGTVYFDADSLKEKTATVVYISQTDKGRFEGTWASTLGPQKSYELRERIGERGIPAYFKNIQTAFGDDIQVGDGSIDSLDQPEMPVTVRYSFSLRQDSGDSKIYINPFIGSGVHQNPFKAAERKYPIEMPCSTDDLYVFTMQIPDGYSVEELPKSARASLNAQDGTFDYLAGTTSGMVQIRCHLKLNKANFRADEYNSLREFYALVVKKEAETIVLKKN